MASLLNDLFGILTVAAQAGIAVCVGLLLFGGRNAFSEMLARNAVLFSFLLVTAATVGSLLYSEVVGYEPCSLCWVQRMFMYPQVVLLAYALWKQSGKAAWASFWLSAGGAAVALYHYLLQLGLVPSAACLSAGGSCAKRYIWEFDYISMPMMALTVFAGVMVLLLLKKRYG